MRFKMFSCSLGLTALAALGVATAYGAPASLTLESLKPDKVTLKSAGKLAFGPDGILFVADAADAKIVALDTGDRTPRKTAPQLDVKGLNLKIAAMLATTPKQLVIDDVVVNPISKNIYISASPTRGPEAVPVILRMDAAGKLTEMSLENIHSSVTILPDPIAFDSKEQRADKAEATTEGIALKTEKQGLYQKVNTMPPNDRGGFRQFAISDMAYANGKLYVAGLSNEEFSSVFHAIPFPFESPVARDDDTGVIVYHDSEGRFITNAPVRAFAITTIAGQHTIFAGYTCSPIVEIPLSEIRPGNMLTKAKTITQLGGGNTPLDMIVYKKGTQNFLLVAGTRALFNGVQRIPLDGVEHANPIYSHNSEGFAGSSGVPWETISELQNVIQLDRYDENDIMIVKDVNGSLDLSSVPLP
jgi:hypothetical protein